MNHATLQTFLAQSVEKGQLTAPLSALLQSLANTSTLIADTIHQGALGGVLGSAGTENVQGETQKKLDIIANDMLLEALLTTGVVAGMASEEMNDCCPVQNGEHHPYLVLFDPLDGSSNIDVNVSIGTIFSVLPNPGTGPIANASFLQAGTQQLAAGYVVYGPQTSLVLTFGYGVDAFTLDRKSGHFLHTSAQIRIPEHTHEFAINMSNQRHWHEPVQRYIAELLAGKTGPREKNFNMRWIASMVADVHRVLTRGGTFMYPQDTRNPEQAGKLRLMYEANPMSLLVEQAGGKAYAASVRILEIAPTDLHQRCPVMLGSSEEIDIVVEYHQLSSPACL
ncbi:MAG: class 1 fructose-bisphosphatase [Limnobacter sp.]|nr:class 1 fructose-bisphosphatase [Limnobacter sp.]